MTDEVTNGAASERGAVALSMIEANRLFTEAGWTPIPKQCWGGGFVMARQVGGVDPNGTQHVKGLDIVRPGDPLYGPNYPDEHHEAAAWLIRMHPANPLSLASLEPAHDPIPESPPAAESPAPEPSAVDSGDEGAAAGDAGSAEDGLPSGGSEVLAHDGQAWPSDSEPEVDYEADFEEIGEPSAEVEGDDLEVFALTDQSEQPPMAQEAAPEPGGGVAYFGDDIHVARLAKMGRLAEIARERKAVLHEGWTVSEFASLQNLLVRIERGEAPDDGAARARFLAISERSRAMSAIDAYQNSREDELERYAEQMKAEETRDQARDAILAFNPDDGWP